MAAKVDRTALATQRSALWLEFYRVPETDHAARDAVMAKIHELDWQIHSARLGIPERLLHARLDGPTTAAQRAAREYLERDLAEGRCLVLAGPAGVGKTHAAVGLLHAALLQERHIGFLYFPALCGRLMDSLQRPPALTAAKSSAVVVFDDYGAEYQTRARGFLAPLIEEIIWHREGNRLPTVITTNLIADQLVQRSSDRVADRLRGEWGRVIELPGESLRGRETA
jgi:DNA replication protein DnaC